MHAITGRVHVEMARSVASIGSAASATAECSSPWSSSCEEEEEWDETAGQDREVCTSTSSDDSDMAQTPQSTSKRTRKRVRRPEAWKKNVRKQRRNNGRRYVSDTTKRVVSIIYI